MNHPVSQAFLSRYSHLSNAHMDYFAKWAKLVLVEANYMDSINRSLHNNQNFKR